MSRSSWFVSVLVTVACGGTPTPAAEPPPTDEPVSAAAPASEPAAAATTGEAPPKAEPESKPDITPRDLHYVMKGDGMEIRLLGASFKPRVKPVRVGAGWGVELDVEAATDDTVVSLLTPKNGALALAGKVSKTSSSEMRSFGDERDGDGETFLTPGEVIHLKRRWPGKGGEMPVLRGESLELHVGLWGIGPDSDSGRPVKRFFVVKMTVDKRTPQPVVSPPPGVN